MTTFTSDAEALDALKEKYNALKFEIQKVMVGQDEAVRDVIISILGNGHCLLVGVPGLAKTLLVNTLSQVLGLSFNASNASASDVNVVMVLFFIPVELKRAVFKLFVHE